MILVAEFDNEIQELKTLPRAHVDIDGYAFVVRVWPVDGKDAELNIVKNIVALYMEQSTSVQIYLDGVFDAHQAYADQTAPPGIVMAIERRYILRTLPEDRLTYD